jgi:hypothetical protein
MRGLVLPAVAGHVGSLGTEGLRQLAMLLAGLAGGAVAAHLARRDAARHGALALALQAVVVLVLALAGFGGIDVTHAAWSVFLGYLGGSLVAVRTGERVPSTAAIDRRAVVLGAGLAMGTLMGFRIGSDLLWLVGQVVIGPVLLVGGAVAGALATRRGGRHGVLAGVLASAVVIPVAAISLGRFLPQMLVTPDFGFKVLLSTAIAIAAGAIGGVVATKSLARSPA